MDVALTGSMIDGGQRSGHNDIDYNSLKCNLGLYILLNGLLGKGLHCLSASS